LSKDIKVKLKALDRLQKGEGGGAFLPGVSGRGGDDDDDDDDEDD
jgi:hypothetical protein